MVDLFLSASTAALPAACPVAMNVHSSRIAPVGDVRRRGAGRRDLICAFARFRYERTIRNAKRRPIVAAEDKALVVRRAVANDAADMMRVRRPIGDGDRIFDRVCFPCACDAR